MAKTTKEKSSITDFDGKFVDSAAFAKKDYQLNWHIERILVKDQPAVIGGPKKCLKTSIALDMALSLASGKTFLGTFPVPMPVRVAVMSGESGAATIKQLAQRICEAKKIQLKKCDVLWSFHLPRLSNKADRLGLKRYLRANKVKVVLIDPLYLCLLSGGKTLSPSNLYDVGPLLYRAGQTCLSAGATPILIHHSTKASGKTATNGQPLDLDDLAFSGIGEYVRQWVLLSRREPFDSQQGQHKLLMAAGGSAGHSGRWDLDIDEGQLGDDFEGRTWRVKVQPSQACNSSIPRRKEDHSYMSPKFKEAMPYE